MVVANGLWRKIMAEKLYNPGRERPVRWYVFWWFAAVHLLGGIGILYVTEHSNWMTICVAIVLFFVCHLSITVGIHRLYAHRTFEPKNAKGYETIILILFSGTSQGDARWWAYRHRQHHDFSDTERDPYTVKHGFWWAHWLWILHDTGKLSDSDARRCPDLMRNQLLDWQEKYGTLLSVLMGLVFPTLVTSLWGDPVGGLLVGGFTRLVVQYHTTWSINSVAHTFGSFRYIRFGTARTQAHWIVFPTITVGEGTSHERHHYAPEDYRIDPRWWAPDLGKWFIWICSRVGLVDRDSLRTIPEEAVRERAERFKKRQLTS